MMRTAPFFLVLIMGTLSASGSEAAPWIAHRGASAVAPENTLPAIRIAIEAGASVVEFDVRETRDGELFLFHDATLDRLCGRGGSFDELRAEEVARLDVGKWFPGGRFAGERPPTLAEAVDFCLTRGVTPLIERKSGTPASYAGVLRELDAVDAVIVQSFDWDFVRAMRRELPGLRVGALGKGSLADHREELETLSPDWIGWRDPDLDLSADLAWVRQGGFLLAVWTVNDPARARLLVEAGVDRIITDRTDLFAEEGAASKTGQ